MLIPILIVGCAYKPAEQKIYNHDGLGIQIIVPENWRAISSQQAGQADIVWDDGELHPTDELLLGYFDPESGEKEAVFILSIFGEDDSEQALEELEKLDGIEKINWKNRSCHFTKQDAENTVGINYTVLENDTVISFFIVYSKSHSEWVTNIMDNIIF